MIASMSIPKERRSNEQHAFAPWSASGSLMLPEPASEPAPA